MPPLAPPPRPPQMMHNKYLGEGVGGVGGGGGGNVCMKTWMAVYEKGLFDISGDKSFLRGGGGKCTLLPPPLNEILLLDFYMYIHHRHRYCGLCSRRNRIPYMASENSSMAGAGDPGLNQ